MKNEKWGNLGTLLFFRLMRTSETNQIYMSVFSTYYNSTLNFLRKICKYEKPGNFGPFGPFFGTMKILSNKSKMLVFSIYFMRNIKRSNDPILRKWVHYGPFLVHFGDNKNFETIQP